MNILLWFAQIIAAFFCLSGSLWRITNYDLAKDLTSVQALPYGVWVFIGVFEIICAVLLVLPAALKRKPHLTAIAASALAIEQLCVTFHHSRFYGLEPQATNPAMWTILVAVLAAFVAYGRSKLKPIPAKI